MSTLPPIRPVYFSRFKKHLADTRKHLKEPDYIQASEKVWGAMSSLVNAMSVTEIVGVNEKKERFESLFWQLSVQHKNLRQVLKDSHFIDARHLALKAEGLHLCFFGKHNYPDDYMQRTLEDCVKVFEEVEKVLT
jgi:hypothetical protein